MSITIFIIILSVLVFVHEMGHFLVAKKAGVRVEEFGIGFPPRAAILFKKWGTVFSLNWIPFGGFVKIFGENYIEQESDLKTKEFLGKNFVEASRLWQVVILVAGVVFNFLLAWLLMSIGFFVGMPYSTENGLGNLVKNPELMIVNVLPDSPAFDVGLKSGDVIEGISKSDRSQSVENINADNVSQFIGSSSEEIKLEIKRREVTEIFEIMPSENLLDGKFAVGISMDNVGTLQLPLHLSVWEGLKTSLSLAYATIAGLCNLVIDAFQGNADLSQVTGPVGIIGIVGDISRLGFIYVLTFAAFISINLAVINLAPFPSLDGGRILFVIIEVIKGSPVNPKIFNWANTFGFFLLILIMIAITVRDVGNLF